MVIVTASAIAAVASVPAAAGLPDRNGRIAFGADRDGNALFDPQIYSVREDGTGLRQLTRSKGAFNACAAYSPDSSKIAYCSSAGGEDLDVWIMNRNGSGKVNVTQTDEVDDFFAAWSPDGSQLVFSVRPVGEGGEDLYVQNADGSGRKQLTDSPKDAGDHTPSWTPDGKYIVFTREVVISEEDEIFDSEIMIVAATGGEPQNIPVEGLEAFATDVSPDGSTILMDADDGNVWTMGLDGSDLTQITTDERREFLARYSPDGNMIVYLREGQRGRHVIVAGADGANPRRLTRGPFLHFGPSWGSAAPLPAIKDNTRNQDF
jgi:Tol biopolymer transport system component